MFPHYFLRHYCLIKTLGRRRGSQLSIIQSATNYLILIIYHPVSFHNLPLAQILIHSKPSSTVIFCAKFVELKPGMKPIRNGRAGGMPDFGTYKCQYQAFGPKLLNLRICMFIQDETFAKRPLSHNLCVAFRF